MVLFSSLLCSHNHNFVVNGINTYLSIYLEYLEGKNPPCIIPGKILKMSLVKGLVLPVLRDCYNYVKLDMGFK